MTCYLVQKLYWSYKYQLKKKKACKWLDIWLQMGVEGQMEKAKKNG